jgi:NADH dehydrogenase FAD-containing subunit
MSHFHETCLTCSVQLMLPRVVIVGSGFGGLVAARALRNTPVRVTLINKRNYHIFRPMLYQVARGLLSADEISGPLRSIFSHQENVDVLLDEVTGINPDQHIIHLTRGELLYDFLILATGIQCNYFGHDEWRHFARGLESLDDGNRRPDMLVANLRFAGFAGFPAWVIWAIVHIYFLVGFADRLFVLLQFGLALLTKRRPVRVLPVEPPSAQKFIDPAAGYSRSAACPGSWPLTHLEQATT